MRTSEFLNAMFDYDELFDDDKKSKEVPLSDSNNKEVVPKNRSSTLKEEDEYLTSDLRVKEKPSFSDYYKDNLEDGNDKWFNKFNFKKDKKLTNRDVFEGVDNEIKSAVRFQQKRMLGLWTGLRGVILGAIFSFFTSGVLIIVNGALSNWVSANVGLPYWAAVLIVFSIALILVIPFVFIQRHIRMRRNQLDAEFYGTFNRDKTNEEIKEEIIEQDEKIDKVIQPTKVEKVNTVDVDYIDKDFENLINRRFNKTR